MPVLEVRDPRRCASGSFTDCGTTLPSSAAIAVLIATATWAGPVPADAHFRPSPAYLRAELAEAVLGLAAERHERMLGIDHRLHDAGVAALRGDAVERALCTAIASAVTFCARRIVPLADRPRRCPTSCRRPRAPPGCRCGGRVSTDVPATPRTSSTLPPFGHVLDQPLRPSSSPRPFWSTLTLIASSVSRMLSKATSTTPASLARLITGSKAVGFCALTTIAS